MVGSPAHVDPLASPEPQQLPQQQQQHDSSIIFTSSPEPLSTTPTPDASNTTETQPAASTLRSLLRAGLSRLPTSRLTPIDSDHPSSPPRAPSPLRTVASAARRLCVPLALPRPILVQTTPAQPSALLRQSHQRRRNERLAVLCQRDCWKVRHHDYDHSLSFPFFHLRLPQIKEIYGLHPPPVRPLAWPAFSRNPRACDHLAVSDVTLPDPHEARCLSETPRGKPSPYRRLAAGIRSICLHQIYTPPPRRVRDRILSGSHSLLNAPYRV